jgi:hypothetical protein
VHLPRKFFSHCRFRPRPGNPSRLTRLFLGMVGSRYTVAGDRSLESDSLAPACRSGCWVDQPHIPHRSCHVSGALPAMLRGIENNRSVDVSLLLDSLFVRDPSPPGLRPLDNRDGRYSVFQPTRATLSFFPPIQTDSAKLMFSSRIHASERARNVSWHVHVTRRRSVACQPLISAPTGLLRPSRRV